MEMSQASAALPSAELPTPVIGGDLDVSGLLMGRAEKLLDALVLVDIGRLGRVDQQQRSFRIESTSKSMMRVGSFSSIACIGASLSASAACSFGTS